ncbi:ABC transporter substrate-binding protein [Qingshengfaniella alkalisoli]|nr:ABC transporter substrate-binding protein [Qingshengfaniella alkalisoli]
MTGAVSGRVSSDIVKIAPALFASAPRLLGVGVFLVVGASQGNADELRVAMLDENPPWEYIAEDGAAHGFEVEIIQAVADRLDVEVSFQPLPFAQVLDEVQAGEADLAIGSISVTEERMMRFDFSQPYFRTDVVIVAPVEAALVTEGQLFGWSVGYLAGASGEDLAYQYATALGLERVQPYSQASALFDALQAGEVRAVISEFASALHFVRMEPAYEIAMRASAGRDVALAMRLGFELNEELNDILSDMKRDGTMAEIYERWFDEPPAGDTVTLVPMDIPRAQ